MTDKCVKRNEKCEKKMYLFRKPRWLLKPSNRYLASNAAVLTMETTSINACLDYRPGLDFKPGLKMSINK
jgi:hypothetical protein